MKHINLVILLCVMTSLVSGSLYRLQAQSCEVTQLNGQDITVENIDTVTLRILVQDALFNNLADVQQGICSVRIEINNVVNISEYNISLHSPNQPDRVQLFGPAMPNCIANAPFRVNHNLLFVPSGDVAMPDMGLPNRWNSCDPNWGNDTQYEGIYYPANGDLDVDFDQGLVNGVWELVIEDQVPGSTGNNPVEITNFQIFFCEPNLSCRVCEPQNGTFTTDTVSLCSRQNLDLEDFYQPANDPGGEYEDHWFVLTDNLIYSVDGVPTQATNSTPVPAVGENIRIAVVTIASEQADAFLDEALELPRRITDIGDLNAIVNEYGGRYCIDMTTLLPVEVNQISNFQLVPEDLTINYPCDPGRVIIADPATDLFLQNPDNLEGRWTDENGNFLGTGDTVTTTQSGIFTYTVFEDDCVDSVSVNVIIDNDPSINIESKSTELDCAVDTIALDISSSFTANLVEWYDLNSRIDETTSSDTIDFTNAGLLVDAPGTYIVRAVNTNFGNNCETTDTILITEDTEEPILNVSRAVVGCGENTARATFFSSDTIVAIEWRDDNDSIWSVDQSVDLPIGDYTLEVTGINSCSVIRDVEIVSDTTAPEFPALDSIPTALTCSRTSIAVAIPQALQSPQFIIELSRANGNDEIIQNQDSLFFNIPDTYDITITNTANQCVQSYNIPIIDSVDNKDLSPIIESISCNAPATISIRQNSPQVAIRWDTTQRTYSDPMAFEQSFTQADTFAYTLFDSGTGCQQQGSVIITGSVDGPPLPDIMGDSILTCNTTSIELSIAPSNDYTYTWVTPDNDTIPDNNITINSPGEYQYIVTDNEGCTNEGVEIISENTTIPSVPFLDTLDSVLSLSCIESTVRILIDPAFLNGEFTFAQSYGGGALMPVVGAEFELAQVGDYTLQATAENTGCSTTKDITVQDLRNLTDWPSRTEMLTCDNPEITLSTDVDSTVYDILWTSGSIDNSTEYNPTVNRRDNYTYETIHRETGCLRQGSVLVVNDNNVPNIPAIRGNTTLSCTQPSTTLSIISNGDGADYAWVTTAQDTIRDTEITIEEAGDYELLVFGTNGCTNAQIITITNETNLPDIGIDSVINLTCDNPSQTLNPNTTGIASFNWIYSDGTTSDAATQFVTDTRLERLELIGDNGCTDVIAFTISIDTTAPDVSIAQEDTTYCQVTSYELSIVGTPPADAGFQWEVNGGIVAIQPNTTTNQFGLVSLAVTDNSNGCTTNDEVSITLADQTIGTPNLQVFPETCNGTMDGQIEILSLSGNATDVRYFLDEEEVSSALVEDLTAGTYTLSIRTAEGCRLDTNITIDQGENISIDLGNDRVVDEGTDVTITPDISGDIATHTWLINNIDSPEDTTPEQLSLTANEDLEIILQAMTISGCTDVDTINIEVIPNFSNLDIYIPNAFAPSAVNELNREFIVTLPDGINVRSVQIFDKWGNMVYESTNINNNPTLRLDNLRAVTIWDGRYINNQSYWETGSYVYRLALESVNQPEESIPVMTGNVLLLR